LSTHHWSYHDPEDFKTPREVVNTLSEIVAKGGCLALGVGPSPDGVIDNRVVKILHQVGLWMRANGKAIYNTRATDIYNDGKTWFTADKNGKTLYAIYALADNDKLPVTITWKGNIPTGKMKLLSNNKTLKYKVSGEEVTVTLPKGMKDDSFALTFNKK
jgi:alpha-L-fucosidase